MKLHSPQDKSSPLEVACSFIYSSMYIFKDKIYFSVERSYPCCKNPELSGKVDEVSILLHAFPVIYVNRDPLQAAPWKSFSGLQTMKQCEQILNVIIHLHRAHTSQGR